ncbi:MAG: beta-ketoacyl-ACP synthase III [Alphaproteobacteria bacterium]|nr:beta-ketoacyl-ACP synthase III [Alphaproteobacteria bacterium]MBL6939585.1 beta-ketoacyl-ACP synthase III [Alphaproteobacteria bacterium]MBL7100042.1 beta-ketoacyl-ACP synthase III [Alphaproteobacteria bacterium]
MGRTAISGTGLFLPSASISNAELVAAFNAFVQGENARNARCIAAGTRQALLPSSEEFIAKASGIRRRHVVTRDGMLDPEVMCPRLPERGEEALSYSAEMGVAAARQALEAAGRTARDIDGVIVSASTMERPYPQIAIEIQQELGITGFGFDMLAACSSATFAIQTAVAMIVAGQARAILCINPEICTSHLNLKDRETHFIFGDAATACIVEAAAVARTGWEIVDARMKSQFSSNIRNNFGPLNRFHPETMGAPDKLITQRGRKVFRDVVPMASAFMVEHLKSLDLRADQLKRLWLHQANGHMNDQIARRVLGRAPLPAEAPCILSDYGNTASAGSMIAFHQHNADLAAGDLGLLCSYGGGYTIGSIVLRKL